MAETGVCVCLQHFPIACRFQNTAIYLYIKFFFEEKDEKQAEREQRGERKGGGLMYVCILKVKVTFDPNPLRDSTILRLRGPPCLVLADAITQHFRDNCLVEKLAKALRGFEGVFF